ncbi:hypothetical protein GCM10010975_29060 [Comamonas phosphati]|nr:hypothetical protein GCM10010975_29060 [Comamonas phosphati]
MRAAHAAGSCPASKKSSSRNSGESSPDLEEKILLIAVAVGAALDELDGVVDACTPELHWVNTLLGNLKTSMVGTYHAFKHSKYARRYLAEFSYRFNRRFNLQAMVPRLLNALAQTKPLPLKALRSPELCR